MHTGSGDCGSSRGTRFRAASECLRRGAEPISRLEIQIAGLTSIALLLVVLIAHLDEQRRERAEAGRSWGAPPPIQMLLKGTIPASH